MQFQRKIKSISLQMCALMSCGSGRGQRGDGGEKGDREQRCYSVVASEWAKVCWPKRAGSLHLATRLPHDINCIKHCADIFGRTCSLYSMQCSSYTMLPTTHRSFVAHGNLFVGNVWNKLHNVLSQLWYVNKCSLHCCRFKNPNWVFVNFL